MLPEFIWIQFKLAECVKCFRMVVPRGMLQWPSVWVRHVSGTSGIDSRTLVVSLGGLVVVVPELQMFMMTGISICWHVGTHFTVLRGSFGRLGKPVASTLGFRRYRIDSTIADWGPDVQMWFQFEHSDTGKPDCSGLVNIVAGHSTNGPEFSSQTNPDSSWMTTMDVLGCGDVVEKGSILS